MARIRKGDTVVVLSGKDKGKSGKVLQVFPDKGKALVENINMLKHFERPSQQNQAGGVIARETPILLCKLALIEPKSSRPTRIGWQVGEKGDKVRIARRTGEAVEQK